MTSEEQFTMIQEILTSHEEVIARLVEQNHELTKMNQQMFSMLHDMTARLNERLENVERWEKEPPAWEFVILQIPGTTNAIALPKK